MKYYMIQLHVPGPYANFPDCPEGLLAMKNCNRVEREVRTHLEATGLVKHAYSWSDGSLYVYVKTGSLDCSAIEHLVKHVTHIEDPETHDPYKGGWKNLVEYMK